MVTVETEMRVEFYDDALVSSKLEDVRERSSFYYHKVLLSVADEVETPRKGIYKLLSNLMWMEFDENNLNMPFESISANTENGVVRFNIDTITVDQLNLMASLLEYNRIDDVRIRARLADILWLRKWKHGRYNPMQYAKLAIDSYRGIPLTYMDWVHGDGCECWSRALKLAIHLKDNGRIELILKALLKVLNEESVCNDERIYDIATMLLLIKDNLTKNVKITIARKLEWMTELELKKGLHSAIDLLDDVEEWYKEAGLKAKVGYFSSHKVECLEKWADNVITSQDDSRGNPFGVASSFYEEALIIAEHMPNAVANKQGILKRLRLKLRKAQKKMSTTMRRKEMLIDVSQLREEVRREMTGIAHEEVLKKFVGLMPVIGEVQSCVSVLDLICTKRVCDGDGRTLRQIDDGDEKVIMNTNIEKRYLQRILFTSSARLYPAYKVIKWEHRFKRKEFDRIVETIGFLPLNQRRCWARALWHGWSGRFFEATLLIAPLMECLIRNLLRPYGVKVSRIENGAEQYIALGTLMKECEGKDIMAKSLQSEIKALFCDNIGPNIRNVVAHGLFKDEDIDGVLAFYVWFFALRLVVDNQILVKGQS